MMNFDLAGTIQQYVNIILIIIVGRYYILGFGNQTYILMNTEYFFIILTYQNIHLYLFELDFFKKKLQAAKL